MTTIQFQVADTFDAQRATQIEVRSAGGGGSAVVSAPSEFPPAGALSRLSALTGVEGVVAIRETLQDQTVAVNRLDDPTGVPVTAPVYRVSTGLFRSFGVDLDGPGWNGWHQRHAVRVAVLSRTVADTLGVTDVTPDSFIFVGGVPFTVVGILDSSPRLGYLTGGVLLPLTTGTGFEVAPERDRVVTVVAPGAAQQIAEVLPVAVSPQAPQQWTAYAPPDDLSLRQDVQGNLQALALGLGGIVLILGTVSIGNVTLTSVLQRIHEIGLRRGLGARPRHVAIHVILDAGVVGALGGMLGTVLGLIAALAVTAAQGWQPVIDARLPALTMAAGIVSGILAGIYPARIAGTMQPTEALRRE